MHDLTNLKTDFQKELQKLNLELSFLKEKDKRSAEMIDSLKRKLLSFELAASGANDGLWDWDLVGDEVFLSGQWLEMLGYKQGDFSNIMRFLDARLHPEDKKETIKALKLCLRGKKEKFHLQFRLKHSNGTYRWIESRGRVLKDARGNPRRISGSHSDISEAKLAKQAFSQTRDSLFDHSLVGIFRTNARTGEILFANPMVWKILETEPQNGLSALNFYVNPEDRANYLKDLIEKGKVLDREIQMKKANGQSTWCAISAIYYPDENVIDGVMVDISRIKNSLVELQKMNYELENFVYQASHDLRSPLRSIMGLINLLRLEKTSAGRESCLEMIEGSIKRLDNLVIDLLQMSKGNRANNPTEEISLVTEINNSVTNFYHVDDSDEIRFIVKINQPVDFVSDLTRIRIVLNNLISNAIKYRSLRRDESFIIIETVVTEEKAVLTVEDNGQGIPQSKLSSIFEMFFRATDDNQGSGLGLYIVKNVVEKLGGNISVRSKVNKGTTFSVEVPNQAS